MAKTLTFDIKYIGINKVDNSEVKIISNSVFSEDLEKFFVLFLKDEKLLLKTVTEFEMDYSIKPIN